MCMCRRAASLILRQWQRPPYVQKRAQTEGIVFSLLISGASQGLLALGALAAVVVAGVAAVWGARPGTLVACVAAP